MTTLVRTRSDRIGNSQGVRIPKVLLDRAQLGDEVELEVGDEQIVIRPVARAWQVGRIPSRWRRSQMASTLITLPAGQEDRWVQAQDRLRPQPAIA